MSVAEGAFDFVRDVKRILDSKGNFPRSGLWSTYRRLKGLGGNGHSDNGKPGKTRVLDYTVAYPSSKNLLFLFRQLFVERLYTLAISTPSPLIIDCGSNIGMSILAYKTSFPDCRIIGFEPHPVLFDFLERNVADNKLANVQLHRKAVSNASGSLDFFLNDNVPGSLNMSLVARENVADKISVEVDKLSQYIVEPVDILKLDIEGAETAVIEDLSASGKLRQVSKIVCEYHHHIEKGVDRMSRILGLLEDNGFGYKLTGYTARKDLSTYQDVMIYAYRK
jgi:FkbM family methyltransferase